MDFTKEVQDEVIRDALAHKLDRPLLNSSNKVWRYSAQNKTPTSPFKISDYLRYINEGHNEMVNLVDINTADPDSTKYSINFLHINKIVVTKESLKSSNLSGIAPIPIS